MNVSKYIRGWFIGNFKPTLFRTKDFEVGIKRYKHGDNEQPHYHKIATEFTAIVTGKFSINGKIVESGDIVMISPRESSDFRCIEDGATVVVKVPSKSKDKYYIMRERK